jgi:prepilin-type N-terminal cleavage/methylation domain-containing protein
MRRHAQGFTLIELAVAMFIIALVLGSLLVPLSTQIESRKMAETQKILEEVRDALLGYAVVNGRLPRPAVSYSDGTERVAICATEADCTGFIPWTVLGTSKLDGWGKIIRYSVTPAFANSSFTLSSNGTKTIQTRATTSPFALANMVTGLPAVIFSHGPNNWGTSDSNNAFSDTSATNVDEDVNANASSTFIYRPYSGNTAATGGEFADIVIWLPMTALANRMVAAGKLP